MQINFEFEHRPIWNYPPHERARELEKQPELNKLTTHEGYLVDIPQPFGTHVVVSAFDGENHYTLIKVGDHNGIINSLRIQSHTGRGIVKTSNNIPTQTFMIELMWYQSMPDGLRKVVKDIMARIEHQA